METGMKRIVDHGALKIAGYVEPWTGGPGLRQASLSSPLTIDNARVRRLDRDSMPEVALAVRALAPVSHRRFQQGSWAEITGHEVFGPLARLSFELLLTRNPGHRVLLDAGNSTLFVVDGQLTLATPSGAYPLGRLPSGRWLKLGLDWARRAVQVTAADPFLPFELSAPFHAPAPMRLVFASDADETLPTLNCRIGHISLVGVDGQGGLEFPPRFTAGPITSGPLRLTLHGNPTFAVTSARWDGSALDPRLAPAHYDAVHFHDTDMAGLDWPLSYEIDIPEGTPSGVYALELVAGECVERIPFFVAPSAKTADIAFVIPTSTYLAYADEYLPPHLYEWIGTDRGHEFARANELRSLYDYHSDGSGVSLVSTRKPKATLRDDYRYPLCGDPHNLPVDLHFLRFCAREGFEVDVLTDGDLHEGGIDLLKRYRAVATGSHPEYLSVEMESAYRAYVAGGGRLAYLGGNGFAAAVAYRDDLMELRRGPTQSGRTWDGPLAEMNLALTGEPGGYLRDMGRGEYRLVGVGISLMGFSPALPFEKTAAGRSPEFAWLFNGVGDRFGDTGVVQGGAAGYEVDSVSLHLGSPNDIVVVAAASGFPDSYVDDPGKWFEGGDAERQAQRRADMCIWRHPGGGVIFSASSVAFLGALPGPGETNDVGRLVLNLLQAFQSLDFTAAG
jgi:N,N-dimethylformamidase